MPVISSREFRESQKACFDQIDAGIEFDTLIEEEYILEPDVDFEHAITMDELLQGVKADIYKMFNNKRNQA